MPCGNHYSKHQKPTYLQISSAAIHSHPSHSTTSVTSQAVTMSQKENPWGPNQCDSGACGFKSILKIVHLTDSTKTVILVPSCTHMFQATSYFGCFSGFSVTKHYEKTQVLFSKTFFGSLWCQKHPKKQYLMGFGGAPATPLSPIPQALHMLGQRRLTAAKA